MFDTVVQAVKQRHTKPLAHGFKPESELGFLSRKSAFQSLLCSEMPLLKEAMSLGARIQQVLCLDPVRLD